MKFGSGKYAPELRFNPIVSFSSILLVAGFVLWCIIDAKGIKISFMPVYYNYNIFYSSITVFVVGSKVNECQMTQGQGFVIHRIK